MVEVCPICDIAECRHIRERSKEEVMDWQPIETAPRDGTRVMLWRGFTAIGSWSEMVIAEWVDDAWRWPDHHDNPSTHGDWSEENIADGYEDAKSFTHWMPLPSPPLRGEWAQRDKGG